MAVVVGEAIDPTCEEATSSTWKGCKGGRAHDEIQILMKAGGYKDFHGRGSRYKFVWWSKCGDSEGTVWCTGNAQVMMAADEGG